MGYLARVGPAYLIGTSALCAVYCVLGALEGSIVSSENKNHECVNGAFTYDNAVTMLFAVSLADGDYKIQCVRSQLEVVPYDTSVKLTAAAPTGTRR